MNRNWILTQLALLAVVVVPLYLSILPSPLSEFAWWSRADSILLFFVLVPAIFFGVILVHSYRHAARMER